ncbi:unnamed protein product, partial [Lepeophtheirus salmonis]
DPFNKHKRRIWKNIRLVPEDLVKKWSLTSRNICRPCEDKLEYEKPPQIDTVIENDTLALNSSNESDADEPINPKLAVLGFNKCLSILRESPTNRVCHMTPKYLQEKAQKTSKSIQNKLINIYGWMDLVSDINVDEETTNALKVQEFDQLIKDLQDKFIPEDLVKKWLFTSRNICRPCEDKLKYEKPPQIDTVIENDTLALNSSNESDVDEPINPKLAVLGFNKCLYILRESPTNRVCHMTPKYLQEKAQKTSKSIQNKLINIYGWMDLVSDINVDEETTNALKVQEFDQLIKDLQDKFSNSTKKLRYSLSFRIFGLYGKSKIIFKTTYHFAKFSKKLTMDKEILAVRIQKGAPELINMLLKT